MLFNSPKRIKRSVDMSEGTDYFVDHYRDLLSKLGTTVSRGAVIDSVLPSLLSLNPKQAVKLSQIVEREGKISQSLYESTPESEELTRNELSKEVETWAQLKSILDVLADGLTPIQPMVKIPMAGDMSILIHPLQTRQPLWKCATARSMECHTSLFFIPATSPPR